MVRIRQLCKLYKTKRTGTCQALADIDLELPDTGLVFLLGKSGSGKSTLLNLLGGLDSPSTGSILVDGTELSGLNGRQLTRYRDGQVGFVFQDHHLVDRLTVYENVALSGKLGKGPDSESVSGALEKVGLAGYEERYPAELSGGERQRVAIARAIVKSPKIILADEPTGNLDRETAETILTLLKMLSREALVFVVSHNERDAATFGDRILRISCGRIIADSHPMHTETEPEKPAAFSGHSMTLPGALRLSSWFLRSKLLSIGLYGFIVAVIMVALALAQTIAGFDGERILKKEMENTNSDALYLTKTLTKAQESHIRGLDMVSDCFPEITASDIQKFRDAGYDGEIYEVLKYNLNLDSSTVSAGIATGIFEDSPYILEPLGTMVVDTSFLEDRFGQLTYLAKASRQHPTGVIITDYLADIMLMSDLVGYGEDYEDLLGYYYWGSREESSFLPRGYINGIIHTGYREKYRSLFEKDDPESLEQLLQNEDFPALVEDIHTRYGFCYSLNPDFRADALRDPAWESSWHYSLRFDDSALYTASVPQVRRGSSYDLALGEDEVYMELSAYNQVFHTNYMPSDMDSFEPRETTLTHYKYFDADSCDPLFTKTVRIIGLFVSGKDRMSGTLIAGDGVYEAFIKDHIYPTGLYFTGGSSQEPVILTANARGFQKNRLVVESVQTMTKAVEVFIPVFRIVAGILSVAVVFVLMSFATKMILEKQTQIGILKAMGVGNAGLSAVFGVQILLIALITCLLTTLGYLTLVDITNTVLTRALRELASGQLIPELDFLVFDGSVAVQNCLLILLLSLISFVIPMQRLRRLDPVRIIKARE